MLFASWILVSLAFLPPAPAACVPVNGDRILAGDLAAGAAEFSALDPGFEIGFSPRPGATRLIRAGELRVLARRYGVAVSESLVDVCFSRPQLSPARGTGQVKRGDTVDVEVRSGAARLTFASSAESGGSVGQTVLVRNPANGRVLRAVVQTAGKVVIQK